MGIVERILDGSQAKDAGVKVGWIIAKVNGEAYSRPVLEKIISSQKPYEIAFAIQKEKKQASTVAVTASGPPAPANTIPNSSRSVPANATQAKQSGAALT